MTFEKSFGSTTVRLDASGFHNTADGPLLPESRFAGTAANTPTFLTRGQFIRDKYELSAGLSRNFGQGWRISLDGYGSLGDVKGYGGGLKVSKRF